VIGEGVVMRRAKRSEVGWVERNVWDDGKLKEEIKKKLREAKVTAYL
jgi:polysaccharide deacetylase 2 family uncharacterized protein YibQ